ncbi:hypothetical protein [Micropruina glycogenica]|uniref:Uncharacterized protein n=1 Tax=Micropruina glycogenica TaxID=75385 RepID=A0A2N9JD29_9ACTN|nr:hypothetical protein [Micropruina glycogenica]SPD86042.1 conserved protein of unknown function [Micropruina glycogenica]
MIESSTVLDTVDNLLQRSGMRRVPVTKATTYLARVFESSDALVGLAAFETSSELADQWTDAEEALTRFASSHLDAQDPKAWDLYLVLITGDRSMSNEEALERARIDTRRARKLTVAAGDRQGDTVLGAFVRRQIAGLLPIPEIERGRVEDPVEEVAIAFGPTSPIPSLVRAYTSGEPLMAELHHWITGEQNGGLDR